MDGRVGGGGGSRASERHPSTLSALVSNDDIVSGGGLDVAARKQATELPSVDGTNIGVGRTNKRGMNERRRSFLTFSKTNFKM